MLKMFYVLLLFCLVILSIYVTLKYWLQYTVWCKSQTCLIGKTAIVTGANTGIGYETALDLAKRGARVILACRNEEKAQRARSRIIMETGNDNVIVKIINMASFESVRAFAKDVNETEDRLDLLVNNAGAGGIGDKRSVDGHLLMMQVNHFSSFLLTHLLIGLLKRSAPSRVINVSSLAAQFAKLDLDKLDRFSGPFSDYAISKLCNICFTVTLAEKLEGSGVTTYSLHPGVVDTDIFRRVEGQFIYEFAKKHLFKTAVEGAQTSIYVAVEKNIEKYNGRYFYNCQPVKHYKTVETPPDLSQQLWEKTAQIVQLKKDETRI